MVEVRKIENRIYEKNKNNLNVFVEKQKIEFMKKIKII